ncbi:MAG: Lipid 3-O-deacylase-related protein [Rhodospirillales bacterium]|nr:Lipid 3-O-deacylase-related protein [Rhodospirillales bacterium]
MRVALLAGFGIAMTTGAKADDKGIIDEVKAGVMAHDITLGGKHVESGVDINGEVLFISPQFLNIIGAPRPHLGGWVNSDGNTDAAYFGLTWDLPLLRRIVGTQDGLTILGSLGGAVHDGYTDTMHTGRKRLGSPVLFRESVELAYQLTPVYSISVMVDHISNANLASHNAGITNAGARIGFKF